MLEFVLLAAATDGEMPFPEPVVEALRRVVPCDTVAYRAWGRDKKIVDGSYAADDLADRLPFWLSYWYFRNDDPHPSEPATRKGDRPPVSAPDRMARPLVLTDAINRRRFWQTGLYFELMRPFSVRDVMKLFLPRGGGGGSVFVFDSSSRGGFSDDDRTGLRRLAPALVQFQRNARLRSRQFPAEDSLTLLTPRELTVLARVSAGETNAEIASALVIGESTVRKHLEHVYEKLDVPNRAGAAARYTEASGPRRFVKKSGGGGIRTLDPPNDG
jgi:DNA-binding CsgD family transcriptional regulator